MNQPGSSGTKITAQDQTETGKRFYHLGWQSQPQFPDEGEKVRKCIQIVEPINGRLDFTDSSSPMPEPETALSVNMVARNAKEMFQNVEVLPDGRYFCRVCNRTYKTHATLTAHLRGAHLRQESRCPEINCYHVSYTENQKKKHQKIHEKQKMKEWKNRPENRENAPRTMFPREEFILESIFQNSKEIPGMIKSKDDSREGRAKYTCVVCEQVFKNPFHASKHTENHSMSPQKCYYCGEIRKGPIDLKLHIMRNHKNEGIMTMTCCGCNRIFTSMAMFQNHANQDECAVACRNLEMREDVYFGELPAGAIIDPQTQNRAGYINNRHAPLEVPRERFMADFKREDSDGVHSGQSCSSDSSDIFSGGNSMVITEFGLKKSWENIVPPEPRSYPLKRLLSENDVERAQTKKERFETTPDGYYEHQATQSQQQNQSSYSVNNNNNGEVVYFPPALEFPYHPFVGKYPDLQPSLQHDQTLDFALEDSTNSLWPDYGQLENIGNGHPAFAGLNPTDYKGIEDSSTNEYFRNSDSPLSKETDIGAQLLEHDIIYEELNKLDFVMPPPDENDREEDLADVFNF